MSVHSVERTGNLVKVRDLREGLEGITVRVRVLEVGEKKTVETKKGPRTLSEALVGDETGRVKLTLWGKLAGELRKGDAVEISNCWTSSFRGEIQVNAGSTSVIKKIDEESLPSIEEIPEEYPPKQPAGPARRTQGWTRRGGSRSARVGKTRVFERRES